MRSHISTTTAATSTVMLLALTAAIASAILTPTTALAQQPDRPAAARAALTACAAPTPATASAPAATQPDPRRAADTAERLFRDLVRERPEDADARVGLAQVLIRCQIQHAGMAGVMTIVGEAEALLRAALAAEPSHWTARYTLAVLLRNLPPMLGRTQDAVREFEQLLAVQGTRADSAHFAQPFLQLGDLHDTAGRRTAAIDVWRRGLALFPSHADLTARLTAIGVEARPDSSWLAGRVARTAADAPPGTEPGGMVSGAAAGDAVGHNPTVYAFEPLRAEVSNHQFREARAGTTLRRLDVYTMPGGTGEMLQALQSMPGATRADDGAELHIRGGDPAETPVFFDGGRLAFPGRWESLQGSAMGVIDASILRRVYFSSGGFSARYGNALSGVVDVETEGRPASASHRLGINMVQAGASVRRPLGERSGAWVTVNGTDTRLIAELNGEAELYTRSPQSLQAVGGLTFEPRSGTELRTTLLSVADRFGRRFEMNGHAGEFASHSAMHHIALSGRSVHGGGRRGLSASMSGSWRENGMQFGVLDRQRDDRAIGGRADGDVVVFHATRVRLGFELLHYAATTSGRVPTTASLATDAPATTLADVAESTWHAGAYVEAEHEPLPGLAVVAGARVDALPGETGATADPRIAAAYTTRDWTVRIGAGRFHQGRWRARLRVPDAARPSGTPLRAEHIVAGVERGGGTLAMRADVWAKRYGGYVEADGVDDGGSGGGAEAATATVAGMNTGADMIARWSPPHGPNGWFTYSLLRSRVELVDGDVVPAALDVTHSATLVARLPLGESWEIGTTGRYATGKPFTPRAGGGGAGAGAPIGDGSGSVSAGGLHSDRLPAYTRLDARLTRYRFGTRPTGVFYLEMLNLLDRRNVQAYTWSADDGRRVPINSVFAHRTFVLGVELQFN
jgi:vitamin B12 transporter